MKQTRHFILLIIFIGNGIILNACSCFTQSLEKRIQNADVVFVGKRVAYTKAIYDSYGRRQGIHHFKIIRYYKGFLEDADTLSFIEDHSNCAILDEESPLGDTFLVYAYTSRGMPGLNILMTDVCTGTKVVSQIHEPEELLFYNGNGWKVPVWNAHNVPLKTIKQPDSLIVTKPCGPFFPFWAIISILLNIALVCFIAGRHLFKKSKNRVG